MIPVVPLLREPSTDQGTFGKIVLPDRFYYSLELPDRNNQPERSCILTGRYLCTPFRSKTFGLIYAVNNVPGRDLVRIHNANYGGDIEKGYRSHLLGCIAIGKSRGWLDGQKAVLISKTALREFMECMQYKPFYLEIKNADNYSSHS